MPSPRLTFCSVTVFLNVGEEYLFVHRGAHTKVDANRLNGIGGKLEAGENYVDAVIRETLEETGYVISPQQISFAGIGRIEGGYEQDWVVGFFRATVSSKIIPSGQNNSEGELLWLHKDAALHTGFEMVDDLKLIFPIIADHLPPFFFTAVMTADEKIGSVTLQQLSNP